MDGEARKGGFLKVIPTVVRAIRRSFCIRSLEAGADS
jgi:hypothetical protein